LSRDSVSEEWGQPSRRRPRPGCVESGRLCGGVPFADRTVRGDAAALHEQLESNRARAAIRRTFPLVSDPVPQSAPMLTGASPRAGGRPQADRRWDALQERVRAHDRRRSGAFSGFAGGDHVVPRTTERIDSTGKPHHRAQPVNKLIRKLVLARPTIHRTTLDTALTVSHIRAREGPPARQDRDAGTHCQSWQARVSRPFGAVPRRPTVTLRPSRSRGFGA